VIQETAVNYRSTSLNGKVRKVLLADDDSLVRRAIRSQLETAGFDVLEANDGIRAMDLLREDIAAVVVDLKLPGAPGLDVLRDVRARFPETPVIMTSGQGNVPDAVQAMRFGAAQYLAKPFHPEEVLRAVRQAVQSTALVRTTVYGDSRIDVPMSELDDSIPESTPATPERPRLAGYTMEQIERWALLDALEAAGGNKAAAARALGVCEKTIYNKLKRMRLQGRHD